MDLRRVRPGEVVAGIAAIALLAAMALLDWYDVDVPPGTEPVGGFDAFRAFDVVDIALVAVTLAAITLPVLSAARGTPGAAVVLASFLTLGSIVASLMLLFRIVDAPDLSGDRFALDRPPFNIGFETTLAPGVFVGLALTIAIAVGGWLAMRDDGTRAR